MGVYIKNMTLDEFSEYGDYCQTLIGTGQAEEVPPHGRLIDADALMKILSKVIDINASIEQRNEATDQERRCLWWFEQQIGIAPTVIPAEDGSDFWGEEYAEVKGFDSKEGE